MSSPWVSFFSKFCQICKGVLHQDFKDRQHGLGFRRGPVLRLKDDRGFHISFFNGGEVTGGGAGLFFEDLVLVDGVLSLRVFSSDHRDSTHKRVIEDNVVMATHTVNILRPKVSD